MCVQYHHVDVVLLACRLQEGCPVRRQQHYMGLSSVEDERLQSFLSRLVSIICYLVQDIQL